MMIFQVIDEQNHLLAAGCCFTTDLALQRLARLGMAFTVIVSPLYFGQTKIKWVA